MADIDPINRIFSKRLLGFHVPAMPAGAHAFTLVEFVLVAAVSVILLMVAATISVNEARSNIRNYVYQSLRDRLARVTFLIEGEVAEASVLITDSATAVTNGCTDPGTDYKFLFAFKHEYTKYQASSAAAIICYYNKILTSDLYRFGPKFDDATGSLVPLAAGDTISLKLVSRETAVAVTSTSDEVKQGFLEYSIKIGRDAAGSDSVWDLSYSPTLPQAARVGTACMTSASATGCW